MFAGFSNFNNTIRKTSSNIGITCEILLDYDVIHPGQTLSGNVAVSAANESRTVEQLIMEVIGVAECKWTFDKHLLKPPKIYKKGTVFSGYQEFFLSRHTLAGGNTGNVQIYGAPDMFPFRTSMPEHLPATWAGQHGTIKYIARVVIKESKKIQVIFTEEIIVHPRRDLQLEQHLLCEARQDIHRIFRYGILGLGTVKVSIWLPICGIAAGQSVPLLCTITNESTVQFGGLVFVLTKLEIYRSKRPTAAVKTFRRDICRVPRMVDILQGTYEYYCMLDTDHTTEPSNQYWQCKCCQVTYEVWLSLQGAIPRYRAYGYPNVDTPGISLIIGTEPLREWNNQQMTNEVMEAVYAAHPPIIMEPLPPDDDIEEMLNNADEELDPETEQNLSRQMVDEPMFQIDDDEPDSPEGSATNEEKEKLSSE